MKKKLLAVTAAILAVPIILSGCSMLLDAAIQDMDFNKEMELKAPSPSAGELPKILFVGNSHTFSNDLPGVFYEFTLAMGHEADVYDLTEGYYKLENFADTQDELGAVLDQALSEEKWDFVVLQENTANAVSPSADEVMFPYARTLDEKIKKAGAQTSFFMTWSPKNGLDTGDLKLGRGKVQTLITENYMKIAKELDSMLIPAGVAFMRCAEQYPDIELWDEDEQHPSLEGTYLTACVAYAVFYQNTPVGCTFTAELDADTAAKLQGIAEKLVLTK